VNILAVQSELEDLSKFKIKLNEIDEFKAEIDFKKNNLQQLNK